MTSCAKELKSLTVGSNQEEVKLLNPFCSLDNMPESILDVQDDELFDLLFNYYAIYNIECLGDKDFLEENIKNQKINTKK